MDVIETQEKEYKRRFFTGTFISKEKLEENNISYPIRLEYYKIKNNNSEYGVEVVKTEYREEFIKIENEAVIKLTKEEDIINNLIRKLRDNFVTPVHLNEVIAEMIF